MNKIISRSENVFYASFIPRLTRKTNCGKYLPLFSAFWRVSTSPQSGKWPLIRQPMDDVARAIILSFAVWILASGRIGFAESYPNRPTVYDLSGIVILGKECMLGVNERCQAAQVSPPFVKTNSTGWYLDQNAMGTMAAKIKSLVPYYANPDTVYNGTTNIAMLSVGGVWAELWIGDHINKFTATPAMDNNPPVYGDNPWRIYEVSLRERYNVLNVMRETLGVMAPSTNPNNRFGSSGGTYAECAAGWESASWRTSPFDMGIAAAWVDNYASGPWTMEKVRNYAQFYAPASANISYTIDLYGHVIKEGEGPAPQFLTFEAPGNENALILLGTFSSPMTPLAIYSSSAMYGNSSAIVPDPGPLPDGVVKGWVLKGYPLINWYFQYCQ